MQDRRTIRLDYHRLTLKKGQKLTVIPSIDAQLMFFHRVLHKKPLEAIVFSFM